MIRRVGVFLLTLAAMLSVMNIVGQAETQSLLTRHTREVTLNGEAVLVGRLPVTQSMRLTVVLGLRHRPELENFLQELYDPSSASYRQFLTVQEFTARFGPSQEDYDAVIGFTKANGFKVVGTSRNRMNVQVKGSVASIEKAFHVTMGVYQHPAEARTFFSPDREPTVDLPFQLWHITGLENYSIPRPLLVRRNAQVKANATTGSGPDDSFLGSDMRAAYYEGTALTGTGQSLGLLEYYGTDLTDLNTYYKNVGQTEAVPVTLVSTDGTTLTCLEADGCDDTEQTIDMTQALGMAPGMSSLVMYVGSAATVDDAAIFNAMATASPLNYQLSSSWTWSPADPNTDDPYFLEFEAQGQSLFQATGDSARWTSSSAIWPADNQYLTGVGGTDLETTKAAGPWASETAWSHGGGGISPDSIPIPSWQVAAADACVALGTDPCSTTLRNGPDVSANANNTFYVCADQETCTENLYGGTSFAAPMWAGYLALVNQQAAANGNKPVGFINPAVYTIGLGSSYDTDFHDITSGSNGYSATTGYDLATGWGSPNGAALIAALAGSGGTGPVVSLSPASLKFAPTVVGVTSAAKTVTLSNTGTGTLNISSIVPGGDFAIASKTCGSTLAAGAKCTVKVTFTPTQAGARTGALTFTDNAPNSPQTLALSGTGDPQATLKPASKTFPTEKVGTTSPATTFTLSNKQSVSLTGISISTTGDFSISAKTCAASLAAKSSCTISVVFKPTQTGTRTGMLKVSDSAQNSPQTSSLKGTGK